MYLYIDTTRKETTLVISALNTDTDCQLFLINDTVIFSLIQLSIPFYQLSIC